VEVAFRFLDRAEVESLRPPAALPGGFAISDIVLGARILAEAEKRGVGTMLSLLEAREE